MHPIKFVHHLFLLTLVFRDLVPCVKKRFERLLSVSMQAPLFLRRETGPLTCCVTSKGQLGDQRRSLCSMTLLGVSSPRSIASFHHGQQMSKLVYSH